MIKKDDTFPQEYYEFMENFLEIPFGIPAKFFSKPKIDIEDVLYGCVKSTTVEYGDASECEVRISYISYIDYESLNETDYDAEIASISKDDDEDQEYINYVRERLESEKEIVKYWSKQSFPSDFKGYIVTPDLTISLEGNLIQATITSQGKIILLYGMLDDNGRLNNIAISSYNILDFAKSWWGDDSYEGLEIHCDNVTKRIAELETEGINPIEKTTLNFKHFLSEYGLEKMYDKPLVALYTAKDILLNKMLENENYKRK